MVPPLLLGSDLIAMLPSRCIPVGAEERLAIADPPTPVEGFPLHLAWHIRRGDDLGIRHVGEAIKAFLGPP